MRCVHFFKAKVDPLRSFSFRGDVMDATRKRKGKKEEVRLTKGENNDIKTREQKQYRDDGKEIS